MYEAMTQMLQIFIDERLEKQLLFMGMLQGSKTKFPIKWALEAIECQITGFQQGIFQLTVHGVPFNDLKVGGSAVEKSLTGMIKLNERELVTVSDDCTLKFWNAQLLKVELS